MSRRRRTEQIENVGFTSSGLTGPATEGRRCPYCELAEAGEMGTAQAFVSHAWLYPFELLVSALEEAAMPPETFFWVDIAVVNQHTNATRGFDWWSGTFRMAVKHIGLTLLVLAPWREAITLERAWCIWEVRPVACLSRGPLPHPHHNQSPSRLGAPAHTVATPPSADLLHGRHGNRAARAAAGGGARVVCRGAHSRH